MIEVGYRALNVLVLAVSPAEQKRVRRAYKVLNHPGGQSRKTAREFWLLFLLARSHNCAPEFSLDRLLYGCPQVGETLLLLVNLVARCQYLIERLKRLFYQEQRNTELKSAHQASQPNLGNAEALGEHEGVDFLGDPRVGVRQSHAPLQIVRRGGGGGASRV